MRLIDGFGGGVGVVGSEAEGRPRGSGGLGVMWTKTVGDSDKSGW